MNLDKLSIFITVIALISPSHAANDPIEGPVKVSEVTFDGGLAVTNDDTTAMPTPHWIDRLNNADPSDDFPDGIPDEDKAQTKPNHVKSYAYSYHTEQKPKVEAIFKWKDGAPPEGRPYSAKGIVIDTDNSTFELPKQELEGDTKYNMISATKNVVDAKKIQAYLTSNRKVERKNKGGVDIAKDLKPLKIRWSVYDKDNKLMGESDSTHTIYVTWAAPTTTLRQETLFNLSCVMANGKASGTQPERVANTKLIYSDFEDQKVNRFSGTLSYWLGGAQGAANSTDLLAAHNGNGICNAWAMFFRDVNRIQGFAANIVQISANLPDIQTGNVTGLAVKDWTFNASGSASAPYEYVMGVDANPGNAGTVAQNNQSPPKYFDVHYACLIDSTLYDPSYGTPESTDIKKYEDATFAGYGKFISIAQDVRKMAFKKNDVTSGSQEEISINSVIGE
jgi:hypothetical protein